MPYLSPEQRKCRALERENKQLREQLRQMTELQEEVAWLRSILELESAKVKL